MFGRHPDIQVADNANRGGAGGLLERGPAAVLFKSTGSLLAGVVQQALAHVLPNRLWAGQADRIRLLDLDDPAAAGARHPQNILGNFGQPLRPDGRSGAIRSGVGARVAGRIPSIRETIASAGPGDPIARASLPTAAASFSICLGVGMRQLAGRSVMFD